MQLSDFDASPNLVALFLSRADELGEKPMLWAKRDGAWQAVSWAEAARRVCLLAESLRRIGLKDGDRVMLVSENRPEWCLADLAIMAAGCVTVMVPDMMQPTEEIMQLYDRKCEDLLEVRDLLVEGKL